MASAIFVTGADGSASVMVAAWCVRSTSRTLTPGTDSRACRTACVQCSQVMPLMEIKSDFIGNSPAGLYGVRADRLGQADHPRRRAIRREARLEQSPRRGPHRLGQSEVVRQAADRRGQAGT